MRSLMNNMNGTADLSQDGPVKLWEHKDPKSTQIWEFKSRIEQKYNLSLQDYEALRQWSIANIGEFWSEVWHFTGIKAGRPFEKVSSRQLH